MGAGRPVLPGEGDAGTKEATPWGHRAGGGCSLSTTAAVSVALYPLESGERLWPAIVTQRLLNREHRTSTATPSAEGQTQSEQRGRTEAATFQRRQLRVETRHASQIRVGGGQGQGARDTQEHSTYPIE